MHVQVHARSLYDCCHVTNSYVLCIPLVPPVSGLRLNFIIKLCSLLFCSADFEDYFKTVNNPDDQFFQPDERIIYFNECVFFNSETQIMFDELNYIVTVDD